MATFVLVHGAVHGGECWRDVAAELRRDGPTVFTPTLDVEPPEVAQHYRAQAAGWESHDLACGHDGMVAAPTETATLLTRIVTRA